MERLKHGSLKRILKTWAFSTIISAILIAIWGLPRCFTKNGSVKGDTVALKDLPFL